MGTGFDCFDPRSHTGSTAVTTEQHRWRMTLVEAMRRRSFTNYAGEWWHFTYARVQAKDDFDFVIAPKPECADHPATEPAIDK
jgi:D-alanyl-D-alanine dipeptidase